MKNLIKDNQEKFQQKIIIDKIYKILYA